MEILKKKSQNIPNCMHKLAFFKILVVFQINISTGMHGLDIIKSKYKINSLYLCFWMGIWVISVEGNCDPLQLAYSNTHCLRKAGLVYRKQLPNPRALLFSYQSAVCGWHIFWSNSSPNCLARPHVASYWGYEAPPIASPQHMPKLWH